MSTPEKKTPEKPEAEAAPLPDPTWLGALRTGIRSDADLTSFSTQVGRLTDDLTARPGGSIAGAVGWTLFAVVFAFGVMVVGIYVLELGDSMMEWLNEG